MELEEIYKQKQIIEQEIAMSIKKFEGITNFTVQEIELFYIGYGVKIVGVKFTFK